MANEICLTTYHLFCSIRYFQSEMLFTVNLAHSEINKMKRINMLVHSLTVKLVSAKVNALGIEVNSSNKCVFGTKEPFNIPAAL